MSVFLTKCSFIHTFSIPHRCVVWLLRTSKIVLDVSCKERLFFSNSFSLLSPKKRHWPSNTNTWCFWTRPRRQNRDRNAVTLRNSTGLVVEIVSRCGTDVLVGRSLVQVNGFEFFQDQKGVESGCSPQATSSFTERLQAERGGVTVALSKTHTGEIWVPQHSPWSCLALAFKPLSAGTLYSDLHTNVK